MKILVCGAGRVGSQIARRLSIEGHDVTVIDQNPELVRRVAELFDVRGVVGHASHPDVQERASAGDAEMIIAATHLDEVNMVACQVAHSVFNVPRKIARVRAQSYLDAQWSDLFRRDHMPLDVVISPEAEVAQVTMARLNATAAFDIHDFLDGAVKLIGLKLTADCPVLDTPLRQLSELFSTLAAMVAGVRRGGKLITPEPSDMLYAGDEIYVLVTARDLRRATEIFGFQSSPARKVVIIGGGNVGLRVAQLLEDDPAGVRARIIERDRARAEIVADRLARTVVLHGDALDPALLEEAGAADADAVLALTEDDKTNVLACALAKQAGCKLSMALTNEPVFGTLAGALSVDAVINPRATTVSSILRHVRRGRIRQVYSIGEGEGEVIEAQVLVTSPIAGRRLRDAGFPAGALVGAVQTRDGVRMPDADLTIAEGDVLVIFALRDAVRQVEAMFRVSVDFF